MIQFYITDIDGNVIKEGSASNEDLARAQAKEGETVVLNASPPDPFEQFRKEKE